MTTVYSTEACPKCKALKERLAAEGVRFKEIDMGSAAGLAELRCEGVFTLSAPVLEHDGVFYLMDDLFEGDKIINMENIL